MNPFTALVPSGNLWPGSFPAQISCSWQIHAITSCHTSGYGNLLGRLQEAVLSVISARWSGSTCTGVIRSWRRLHFTGHFGSLPVCSSSGYKRQCYLQYTHPAWRWRCVPSSCIITTCASSQEWDLTPWPPEGDRRHCFGSQSVSRPDGGGGVQSLYAPGCKTFHADVCSYIHGRHRGDHPAFPIQNGNGCRCRGQVALA